EGGARCVNQVSRFRRFFLRARPRLSEWFDERGNLPLGSLGLAFAAKHSTLVGLSFGSMQCVEDEGAAPPGKKASFAKAWCLAAEARERDQ
ncbi:unnamed protein product, partial [Prorocentrum cordatum]